MSGDGVITFGDGTEFRFSQGDFTLDLPERAGARPPRRSEPISMNFTVHTVGDVSVAFDWPKPAADPQFDITFEAGGEKVTIKGCTIKFVIGRSAAEKARRLRLRRARRARINRRGWA